MIKETNFTPGPLTVKAFKVIRRDGRCIADFSSQAVSVVVPSEQRRANAELFSAGTDLYAACQKLVQALRRFDGSSAWTEDDAKAVASGLDAMTKGRGGVTEATLERERGDFAEQALADEKSDVLADLANQNATKS